MYSMTDSGPSRLIRSLSFTASGVGCCSRVIAFLRVAQGGASHLGGSDEVKASQDHRYRVGDARGQESDSQRVEWVGLAEEFAERARHAVFNHEHARHEAWAFQGICAMRHPA